MPSFERLYLSAPGRRARVTCRNQGLRSGPSAERPVPPDWTGPASSKAAPSLLSERQGYGEPCHQAQHDHRWPDRAAPGKQRSAARDQPPVFRPGRAQPAAMCLQGRHRTAGRALPVPLRRRRPGSRTVHRHEPSHRRGVLLPSDRLATPGADHEPERADHRHPGAGKSTHIKALSLRSMSYGVKTLVLGDLSEPHRDRSAGLSNPGEVVGLRSSASRSRCRTACSRRSSRSQRRTGA